MTPTLHLPPELEQRLTQEAQRQGCSLDDYTLELLNKSLPSRDHRTEIVTLLQTWSVISHALPQLRCGRSLPQYRDHLTGINNNSLRFPVQPPPPARPQPASDSG